MANFNVLYNIIAVNKFSKVAQKIGLSTDKLRGKMKGLSDTLNKSLKKGLKDLGGMILAGGVVLAMRRAIQVGARFQDSLMDLSAITGAVGRDLDFMKGKAFELGKVSARSGNEVLGAFTLVASAKPELLSNTKALAGVTEQVLLLSNAAGIDLVSASNITAQGLNIFGEGADQAARFVNVLAAGSKYGSSMIRETGEAMLIAGPSAKAAGLSFEQLNAAIQAVALGGIKGARSGTALNAILGRLQRGTKGVMRGIDFSKTGVQGGIELVKKRMDRLRNSTQRAQFAAKVFGEEHAKVGFALLDNVGTLDAFERKLTGTNVAQEQADKRLGTFNAKIRRFGTLIEEKVVSAFLLMEPLLSGLVDLLGIFVKGTAVFLDTAILKPLKVIGMLLGKTIGMIATGFDMSGWRGTFDELKEVIAPDYAAQQRANLPAGGTNNSQSNIDVNLNAPAGVIKNVQSSSKGGANINVGANMVATAQ